MLAALLGVVLIMVVVMVGSGSVRLIMVVLVMVLALGMLQIARHLDVKLLDLYLLVFLPSTQEALPSLGAIWAGAR